MERGTALSYAKDLTLLMVQHQAIPFANSEPASGKRAGEFVGAFHEALVKYFESVTAPSSR